MTSLAAITVQQPHASLIAEGVMWIETRARPTSYRGRVLVHAGMAIGRAPGWEVYGGRGAGFHMTDRTERGLAAGQIVALPRGVIVASAVLTDCVPIVHPGEEGAIRTLDVDDNGQLWIVDPQTDEQVAAGEAPAWREVTDQAPYGDFTPGRWALLLDAIKPTHSRCPACWGESVACLDHPLETVRSCLDCWGGAACPVCAGTGRLDPIPARGRPTVPWRWNPSPPGAPI